MFTGIITDVGSVRSVHKAGDLRIEIETLYDITTIDIGASIACDGVCLTVVEKNEKSFFVDVSKPLFIIPLYMSIIVQPY